MTRIFFYTDTHNFHPELLQEWQDGFVSNSLAHFLTDAYAIVSIMQWVRSWAHEILNVGPQPIRLVAQTKSHKYVYTSARRSRYLYF